eukprot:CAMPEP_0195020492 /NCGR_PEP_ID=MMETSP0326_2-20130528/35423_1 /TAXON_ID=2866 ORGANISM="Crypthecodinium cohnii, Strain Seligo" /NCGR_SAMPLE_ID=MMETSP0326_2 /ASSEMBLY_ACC=CAM_ASM_000348 /LENGTH=80 /DNA_ID=CAMNT_0040039175 /DNA_START=270 /DNA_END=509 /DNA_ORIENTATION=+
MIDVASTAPSRRGASTRTRLPQKHAVSTSIEAGRHRMCGFSCATDAPSATGAALRRASPHPARGSRRHHRGSRGGDASSR